MCSGTFRDPSGFFFPLPVICGLQETQASAGTLVRDKFSLIDSAAELSKQERSGSWPEKYSADRLMQQQREKEKKREREKGSGISQSRVLNLFICLFLLLKSLAREARWHYLPPEFHFSTMPHRDTPPFDHLCLSRGKKTGTLQCRNTLHTFARCEPGSEVWMWERWLQASPSEDLEMKMKSC